MNPLARDVIVLFMLSYTSYLFLFIWLNHKQITEKSGYINFLALSWLAFALPMLWYNFSPIARNSTHGMLVVYGVAAFLTISAILAYISNKKIYRNVSKKVKTNIIAIMTFIVIIVNVLSQKAHNILFNSSIIFFFIISAAITTVLIYKYHKKITKVSLIYTGSGYFLTFCLFFFRDLWDMEFMLTVFNGCVMLIILGFSILYLEYSTLQNHKYKINLENQMLKIKEAEHRAHTKTFRDDITQLRNRTSLIYEIENIIAQGKEAWAVMVNINNFKILNSHLGYQTGNAVLKNMGSILQEEQHDPEKVFRFENDIFLVLVEGNKNDVIDMSQQIAHRSRKEIFSSFPHLNINVSIAVTSITQEKNCDKINRELFATLLNNHDDHISVCRFFDQSYQDEFEYSLEIQKRLVQALDKHSFEMWYQPKFDIEKNCMTGAEALLRLRDKEPFLSPGSFIPIAEKQGMIIEIGYQTIEQVFLFASQCHSALRFNINLSPVQLFHEEFYEKLVAIVKKTRVRTDRIVFEVTETALMSNFELGVQKLEKLKRMGFSISLDDFGSGYSSFSYLVNLPISELKIDKGIIDNLENDQKKRITVRSLVVLARELGMELIVEGVESDEQLQILKSLECRHIQGYVLGKPMPGDDFIHLGTACG